MKANTGLRFAQGIPAILMGLIALVFLPDRPEMTSFLTEDERKIAVARMNRATSGVTGLVLNKGKQRLARKTSQIELHPASPCLGCAPGLEGTSLF